MNRIKYYFRLLISHLFWKPLLGKLGERSVLYRPLLIVGKKRIFIGERCHIRDLARIEVINRPHLGWKATLNIGNHVGIEQGVHIVCQGEVNIEDNVSITAYCAIVDTYHPHNSPDTLPKIGDRLPDEFTFVHIGAGTIIGMHSVILPNVRIGKGCVIGAGSVVNRNIPDYSLAVGAPARVVSKFDPISRVWNRISDFEETSGDHAVAGKFR
jgi:acetyltransferase-like isoleucine patch superfamily enzyme